jgi:hypothetical protein
MAPAAAGAVIWRTWTRLARGLLRAAATGDVQVERCDAGGHPIKQLKDNGSGAATAPQQVTKRDAWTASGQFLVADR